MNKPLLQSTYDSLLSRGGLVLLALLLILNIAAIYASHVAHAALDNAFDRATEARQIMLSVERMRSYMFEIESAQRGFLITQDKGYLKSSTSNVSLVRAELANIRKLTPEHEGYAALLRSLGAVFTEKLTEMEQTIALVNVGAVDQARNRVSTNVGKNLMDDLDATISRLVELEDAATLVRVSARKAMQARLRVGFAGMSLLNGLLLFLGAYTILRNMRHQKDATSARELRRRELAEAVDQRTAELRELSLHLQDVLERERHRLSRELHDELGGTLSAIKLDVAQAKNHPAIQAEEKLQARFKRALLAVDEAIRVKRRVVEDLRPTLIDNLGLDAALRWHCDQFFERSGIPCDLDLPAEPLYFDEAQSIGLYRLVQEALTNTAKYAEASAVKITLRQIGEEVELSVSDDGIGIAVGKQSHPTSHGLIGMRERMAALGGRLQIDTSPGRGTTLIFSMPMLKPPAADSP